MNNLDMAKFHKLYEEMFFPKLEYRSIIKDYDISKNVNTSLCAKCGGTCCKNCGCHFSPDDFESISFESLKKELEKGFISIDYVDGEIIYQNIGLYILRIRNKESPIVDTGLRPKTPCILLTEKGCKLNYEQRPTGGKLLIPHTISKQLVCSSEYSIEDCCYEWKPHQRLLYQLTEYFKDKHIPCSL